MKMGTNDSRWKHKGHGGVGVSSLGREGSCEGDVSLDELLPGELKGPLVKLMEELSRVTAMGGVARGIKGMLVAMADGKVEEMSNAGRHLVLAVGDLWQEKLARESEQLREFEELSPLMRQAQACWSALEKRIG